jgi:hypothetical protein
MPEALTVGLVSSAAAREMMTGLSRARGWNRGWNRNRGSAAADDDQGEDRLSSGLLGRAEFCSADDPIDVADIERCSAGAPGSVSALILAPPEHSQRDRFKFQLLCGRNCPIRVPASAVALFSAPIEQISAPAMLISMSPTSSVAPAELPGAFWR